MNINIVVDPNYTNQLYFLTLKVSCCLLVLVLTNFGLLNFSSTERMKSINKRDQAFIEYADIADLVKMLNQKTGGKFQDNIRDAIDLLIEE